MKEAIIPIGNELTCREWATSFCEEHSGFYIIDYYDIKQKIFTDKTGKNYDESKWKSSWIKDVRFLRDTFFDECNSTPHVKGIIVIDDDKTDKLHKSLLKSKFNISFRQL